MPILTDNDSCKLKEYISFIENSYNTSFFQDPRCAKIKKLGTLLCLYRRKK